MHYFLALGLLAVLACLAAAGFFLLRRHSPTDSTARTSAPHAAYARALAWRVDISVVLFVCLLLAWHLGYIQPSGLRMLKG